MRSSSRCTTTRTTAASARTSRCRRRRRAARRSVPIRLSSKPIASPAAGGYGPAFGPGYMNDPRNQPCMHGPVRQRQPAQLPHAVHAALVHGTDTVRAAVKGRRTARSAATRAHRRQGDASVRRAGQSSAHRLLARPGQPPIHVFAAARRRHLPHQGNGIHGVEVVEEPAQMRSIKNDPNYNECWPRALVPYRAHLRHEGAEHAAPAGEQRLDLEAPARGDAVRPGRHVELLQAGRATPTASCRRGP